MLVRPPLWWCWVPRAHSFQYLHWKSPDRILSARSIPSAYIDQSNTVVAQVRWLSSINVGLSVLRLATDFEALWWYLRFHRIKLRTTSRIRWRYLLRILEVCLYLTGSVQISLWSTVIRSTVIWAWLKRFRLADCDSSLKLNYLIVWVDRSHLLHHCWALVIIVGHFRSLSSAFRMSSFLRGKGKMPLILRPDVKSQVT